LSINSVTEYVFPCNREENALMLADMGFSLLPLTPKDKTPYSELLPRNNDRPSWALYRNKPASAADVKAWFDFNPDINIGIMTGPASVGGLYILDVDQVKKLPAKELPPTVTVKTGRGYHYYFSCDQELPCQKFNFGELKGVGGYVVGPGSEHENGEIYAFVDMLGPADAEIAKLPKWLKNSEAAQAAKPLTAPKDPETSINSLSPENHISKKRVRNNSVTCSQSFEQLEQLNQDPATAFKIMALCGREVDRIGKAFTCPLPGHSERKPSAALYQEPGRPIILNDFHEREAGRFSWPLVDVYASVKVGRPLQLKKGERAIWWLRALHEIGAVNPPALKHHELPQEAKKPARKLYQGFVYLMELRQLYQAQDSAPFSWSFASRWCDIKSAKYIQQAMKYLLEHGYLYMKQPGVKIGEGEGPRSALFSIGRPKLRRERS
jgi:hypothetical protein